MPLEVIYEDNNLVAINKPPGLLVHRTKLAKDADQYALQVLRKQLGRYVYPCHRIDRKTSGVLLFAMDNNTNRLMMEKFSHGQINKKYLAIVRGFTPDQDMIDYPIKRDINHLQPALTRFRTIEKREIDLPYDKFPTSRYSLVEIEPVTGRMHQIRKHFAHIFHPIIGDRPYGCNKQNKLFNERWNMTSMMLHAYSVDFLRPITDQKIIISAYPPHEFLRTCETLGFEKISQYLNFIN
ncbi:MAG: hypothetical protein JW731_08710 [Bacteroidales bacterium]|nr:hypothetical protein [Bacteroidales bacterium]